MQYTGDKLEKVDQNIPLRTWTRNLRICSNRRGLCRSVLLTNDWNSLTYTCLMIKSEVYEAFMNTEESFRESPF